LSPDGNAIMVGCGPIAIPPQYLPDLYEVRDYMAEVAGEVQPTPTRHKAKGWIQNPSHPCRDQ
jgi:hypothetical protein